MNSKDQSIYYKSVITINQDNKEYQLSKNVLQLEAAKEEKEVQTRERISTQRVM